ncbi:hypothetical protein DL95DRAFT_79097 [Leptodontidium sp. 2 PMI_412]|nr:hypothetical protein DL95DRAFT_79097 [Leptodontidium sp. 2 PMI_412]
MQLRGGLLRKTVRDRLLPTTDESDEWHMFYWLVGTLYPHIKFAQLFANGMFARYGMLPPPIHKQACKKKKNMLIFRRSNSDPSSYLSPYVGEDVTTAFKVQTCQTEALLLLVPLPNKPLFNYLLTMLEKTSKLSGMISHLSMATSTSCPGITESSFPDGHK